MVKKLFSVYSSNFLLGILGVITVPILLKNIGVDGYGYYGIYLTLLSYFTLFELGILKHFTKLISQKKKEVNDIISCFYYFTSLVIILFIPILVLLINFLFDVNWREGGLLIAVITSLEYIFHLPTKIYSSYATANKKFERLSFFNFISGIIRYTLIILGSMITQDVFIIIILLAIRRMFDIRLSRVIIGEKIKIFEVRNINKINLLKVFNYYKESIYLSGTQALQINLNGMISIIISKLFGVEGLGLYRSTLDVLSKIWFFSNGLGLVIFPYFVGNTTGNKHYKKYTFFSWIFYTLVYIGFLFLFPLLNEYLLNGSIKNEEGMFLYLFVLVSVLLVAQGNLSFEFLQAKGKYKYLMRITIITNVAFLVFFLLIYNHFPYVFSVAICWMISLIIQTISFERKSLRGSNFFLIFSILLIISWILLGVIYFEQLF